MDNIGAGNYHGNTVSLALLPTCLHSWPKIVSLSRGFYEHIVVELV